MAGGTKGDLTAQGQSTVTPQMGWSSNIGARSQPQAATGWSQNIGMSQPQAPGTGMGMGWAGSSQGPGASQGGAGQLTAANIMMGGGQPLLPQGTPSQPYQQQPLLPQGTPSQPHQQQPLLPQGTPSQPYQQPAPSANPFADLNFLS